MQLERMYPSEGGAATWQNDFTSVTVQKQPLLGITGSTGAVGGLVAHRLAHCAPVLVVRDPARAPDLGLLFMVSAAEAPDRRDHHDTEEAIRESGMAFTILRDNFDATYTLTGPEALTLTEIAARAGAVLGRNLRSRTRPSMRRMPPGRRPTTPGSGSWTRG